MFGFGKKKHPVKQSKEGSHGDHWGAIFGFEDDSHVEQSVHRIIDDLEVGEDLGKGRVRVHATSGMLSILGIGTEDYLETLYPALNATATVPVTVKELVEWTHVGGIEGQVRGVGRDVFGLDFFALDYAENKDKYQSSESSQVSLAGLAYIVDSTESMPEEFSSEFCGYIPNTDMPCGHDFNFVGDVLSVEDASMYGEEFQLLRVKLINDENNPEMFNLPLLANRKNIGCPSCNVGDKVSGCFWLQGRIAGD